MNLNLDLNRLGQINEATVDEEKERKRIVNYLYQLTEQLRYWQYNLEEENFAPELREDYKAIKNGLSELRVEADEISSMVMGEDGLAAAWTVIRQNLEGIALAAGRIETMTDGTNYATRLINSALNLTPTDLTVTFNDREAMRLTAAAVDFTVDTLSVTGQIVGNVVNTQGADSVTVSGGNATMASLQAWVNSLGKYLTGNITITISAPLEGALVLQGFKSGNGSEVTVNFTGNGCLWGRITARDCDRVTVTGKNNVNLPDIIPTTQQAALVADGVKMLRVTEVVASLSGSSYSGNRISFRTDNATNAIFTSCCAMGGAYGFYLRDCGQSLVNNCWGGQGSGPYKFSTSAVIAMYGQHVKVAGSRRPKGSCTVYLNAATVDVYSGSEETPAAADDEELPLNPGIQAHSYANIGPALSSNNTYGGTMITTGSSATSTDQSAVVSHTATKDGKIRSGKTQAGYNWGIWWFGTQITGLTDKNSITAASVTLNRAANQGGITANKVNLYWYASAKSGASSAASETPGSYFNNGGTARTAASNIAVNPGKSVTVELSGTALTALKNGTLAGFGVGGSDYMEFEKQGCVLNVIW